MNLMLALKHAAAFSCENVRMLEVLAWDLHGNSACAVLV